MRACVICGAELTRYDYVRRCISCRQSRFLEMAAIRARAHAAVAREKREGRLPDLRLVHVACVDCGKRARDYDHRDYSRPLDVEPVCRSCNLRRPPPPQIEEYLKAKGTTRWLRADQAHPASLCSNRTTDAGDAA